MIPPADLRYEFELHQQGLHHIAGLDEAGRGAWAGPVAAGAVILPLDRFDLLHTLRGVNDSKQLSPAERENLLPRIMQTALAVGFGYASHTEIDQLGIVPATRLAMRRAVEALTVQPDALLTDAMSLPELHLPCVPLIRGDQKSLSIAAASIVAKVIRDQVMDQLDERYPQYGFLIHKGYGTDLHHKALKTYGPTEIHRATFAPIRALLHPSENSE